MARPLLPINHHHSISSISIASRRLQLQYTRLGYHASTARSWTPSPNYRLAPCVYHSASTMASVGKSERVDTSTGNPQTKRQRQSQSNGHDSNDLPSEIWARICSWLPFESVRSCASTSRAARGGMSLVETIHIYHAYEIHAMVPARHSGATEININSLFVEEYDDEGEVVVAVNNETAMRTLPVLSRFTNLQRASFPRPLHWRRDHYHCYTEDLEPILLPFIDSIAAAFRSGVLADGVKVLGLFCPKSYDYFSGMRPSEDAAECRTCISATRSFPLSSAVRFQCKGSSLKRFVVERPRELDVCLTRSQIETLIKDRSGGREMLCAQDRLLHLLGSGSLYRLASDDNNVLSIVKFSKEELNEIKSLSQNADLDVKRLSPQVIHQAIMRSFAKDERQTAPPASLCYIAHDTLQFFRDEIHLPLEEPLFYQPTSHMAQFVPCVARALNDYRNTIFVYSDEGILVVCATLLRDILENGDNQIAEEIVRTRIIRDFSRRTRFGRDGADLVRYELVQIIDLILAKGASEQLNVLTEQGAISIISGLLASPPCKKAADLGTRLLHHFVTESDIQSVIKAGAIFSLLYVLTGSDNDVSGSALKSLQHIFECFPGNRKAIWDERIMSSLLTKMRNTSSSEILRRGTNIIMEGCQVLPEKAPNITYLSALLLKDDGEVVRNVITAIKVVLEEADSNTRVRTRVASQIEPQMFSPMMLCLDDISVQELAAESLWLITKPPFLSPIPLQAVIDDGLAAIPLHVSQKTISEHSWAIMMNVLDCDHIHPTLSQEERVQAFIDSNAIHSLKQSLGDTWNALLAIERATKNATPAQIKCMVNQGCIGPFCDVLNGNETRRIERALTILKKVLAAASSDSCHAEEIEATLFGFEEEIKDLKEQESVIDLLEKKQIWLQCDYAYEEAKLAENTCDRLKKQRSVENKRLVGVVPGFTSGGLRLKGAKERAIQEGNRDLDNLLRIEAELDIANRDCDEKYDQFKALRAKAKERGVLENATMWEDRLHQDDLPKTLDGVKKALDEAYQALATIIESRTAMCQKKMWKTAIAGLVSQLEGLFRDADRG